MSPSEKEFGELIGEVRGMRREFVALGQRVVDMQASNDVDHANVIQRLDRLDEKLAGKADGTRVDGIDGRVDALESHRDVGKGRALVLGVVGGALVTGAVSLFVGLIFIAIGGGAG